MPIDAYDPCLCGSGKKFKFCCIQAADEIEKVRKFQENHQNQSSLQVLDRLIKSKGELPWAFITRASILLNEGHYVEARNALVPLLKQSPDHPFGMALFATTEFAVGGFTRAKPAIYRAFQRAAASFPDVVGSLAMGVAAWMFSQHKYFACRQHLAHAMRLVPDEDKQDIFLRLLEFDSNGDLPYPLRSVHQLTHYAGPDSAAPEAREETQRLVQRAESLVAIGCYEFAADAYRQLAERDPECAGLWQNAGFCAAWDGNETAAAAALHRAAQKHADAETAVECETLAQLLDLNQPEAQVGLPTHRYRVSSVSRLLTKLDDQPRIVRLPQPPSQRGEQESPTILFNVLDRPPLPEVSDLWPALEEIPQSIAQLGIAEEVEGDEPQVFLTGFEGQPIESARELFEACAGDVIESSGFDDEEDVILATAREQLPLLFTWHLPARVPVVRQRQLEKLRWEKNLQEIWPNTPMAGLGGKTPNEARGNAALETPLRAALYVLDAFCDRNSHLIDLPKLCADFQVAPPTPIAPSPQLPLHSFSAMQLHRLKVPDLSDEQLFYVLNRVLLIHHGGFLHHVLRESLARPSCAEKMDRDRTYNTLTDLASDRYDRDAAYHWIHEAQERAKTHEQAFEKSLHWEMRELLFRVEDPGDPNLMPLVARIVRKYAKKLPKIVQYVTALLVARGIDPPENLREMAEDETGTFTSGGIWTPGQEIGEPVENKLWLPGQS